MSLYFKLKRNIFPVDEGNVGFVPQFRLEGRSRDGDSDSGLKMRIADPLWMLGRQWQFGEFKGEDNGSPIVAQANFRKVVLHSFTPGPTTEKTKIGNLPLEARVEAMELKPKDLRSKVRIGQKFESLIRSQFSGSESRDIIDRLRTVFPLKMEGKPDQKSLGFFNLMSGSVLDGGHLWENIQNNGFPNGEFIPLESVTALLKTWYQNLYFPVEGGSSWQSRHLHHQFTVQGEQDVELRAPDYQSGHLDWYSFDSAAVGIDPTEESKDSDVFTPVRVSFAGMPHKRLYSFEDSRLDLSGMEVDQSDLVKLMIIDFSLIPTNNWFTIPHEMEPGEISWINHITVKDVFGITTVIENDENTGQYLNDNPLNMWDVFKIRPSDLLRERGESNQELYKREEHFLYLPPVATFRQESRQLEEILFIRDEYANMVWAIEKTVRNTCGTPVNGFDLHLEINGPFQIPDNNDIGIPQFRLASPVPTNWIPYLPSHIDDSPHQIELIRALMMRNESDSEPVDIEPLTVLAQSDLLRIREEAIPRAGVRVQMTRQRIRGTDGATYIWVGRKVLAGRGVGSSGLMFDQIQI